MKISKNNLILLIKEAIDADDEITLDSSMENVPEWDSLGHLSVLTALDDSTEGKLHPYQLWAMHLQFQKLLAFLEVRI